MISAVTSGNFPSQLLQINQPWFSVEVVTFVFVLLAHVQLITYEKNSLRHVYSASRLSPIQT
ncbi:hypothetical protein [Nostoc sp.]